MGKRRMISSDIIDTDLFLDMATSSRLLYYDLSMRADDDGFINNIKKIMRDTRLTVKDLNLLIKNNYILSFDNGIYAIVHWKKNNYIRPDRYKETLCINEKKLLEERDEMYYKR